MDDDDDYDDFSIINTGVEWDHYGYIVVVRFPPIAGNIKIPILNARHVLQMWKDDEAHYEKHKVIIDECFEVLRLHTN